MGQSQCAVGCSHLTHMLWRLLSASLGVPASRNQMSGRSRELLAREHGGTTGVSAAIQPRALGGLALEGPAPRRRPGGRSRRALRSGSAVSSGLGPAILRSAGPVGAYGAGGPALTCSRRPVACLK
uniref:Uncharacterized protein n=1 Tax=Rangifer tarandus platyrhynchus TaxID=3082113 RepID=A0ACB0DPS9_RANTA|nr:unnamed protein product [Rangifer tarandus platyrhynchus]